MRASNVLVVVLLIIMLPGFSLAQTVEFQVSPEKVEVRLPHVSESNYRVWHTNNPMKVIIDLDYKIDYLPHSFKDVALQDIRLSSSPFGGSRIVLEFDYQLPEPEYYIEGDRLVVEIDKVFVRSSVRTVTGGVRYGHQRRGLTAGPLIINYLEINLNDPEIEVHALLGQDKIFGREYVSEMAKRGQAMAAVNGAYFAPDGRPLGLVMLNGELISEPYAKRTAIGIGPQKAVIGQVDFAGKVRLPNGDNFAITGMNRARLQDDLIVYTPFYGEATRTNVYGLDVVVEDDRVVEIVEGSTGIPLNGYVLSGHGKSRDLLKELSVGDQVQLKLELTPDWREEGIEHMIGGGPRLVRDGQIYITSQEERFQRDVADSRAPRTALGVTETGRLLLVTVNGRQPGISVGMTLEELAQLMIDLGAHQAMNLDGGGSTTMVIRDMVLNLPSDGIERPVSNGLLIVTPESRR